MKPRKLNLRHETIADLTPDQLHDVNGASGAPCEIGQTLRCPTTHTITPTGCNCTGYYPSLNAPCTEWLAIDMSNIC